MDDIKIEYLSIDTFVENKIFINVVLAIFPNLNNTDKQYLLTKLLSLLKHLIKRFVISDPRFLGKIFENDYMDLKALMLLLLPYINDPDGTKKKKLKSLDELYVAKVSNVNIIKGLP